MSVPRVFISSTCFDLSELRQNLADFLESFGCSVVLSEEGDVPYYGHMHTHDYCIQEVHNCDYFILIIGGRFGGRYVNDKNISIVNAEYLEAVKLSKNRMVFIKRDVLHDHHVYIHNKNIETMHYPSIDKQDTAKSIFEFIDQVRKQPIQNQYFPFDNSTDIIGILRKQFSMMIYQQMNLDNVYNSDKEIIDKLQHILLSTHKINEHLDKNNNNLEDQDYLYLFFSSLSLIFGLEIKRYKDSLLFKNPLKNTSKIEEYLIMSGLFTVIQIQNFDCIMNKQTLKYISLDSSDDDFSKLNSLFNKIISIDFSTINFFIDNKI
ncbi:MAG: DUF4062 domain-containing protein [Bacteroidetes bacterium]|nr:DUF4062 domain-containing protein [Bacteroidota bacterium]